MATRLDSTTRDTDASTSNDTETETDADTETTQCPECGGDLTPRGTETICTDCGLVVADQPIDHGPEWRAYPDDDTDNERTGAPRTPTLHDRGLSTDLGRHVDAYGNTLSGKKRTQLARLRQAHHRARFETKAQRMLAHGLAQTRRIVTALDLGDAIRDQACDLFQQAHDAGLVRGRSLNGFAGATVYAVCRCNRLPRTRAEICDLTRATESQLDRAYDVMNRELGLPTPPLRPTAFVPRLADALDLPDRTRKRAQDLAGTAHDAGLTVAKSPSAFAGACLYYASLDTGPRMTQAEVADVADTTAVTLRKHYHDLADLVGDDD